MHLHILFRQNYLVHANFQGILCQSRTATLVVQRIILRISIPCYGGCRFCMEASRLPIDMGLDTTASDSNRIRIASSICYHVLPPCGEVAVTCGYRRPEGFQEHGGPDRGNIALLLLLFPFGQSPGIVVRLGNEIQTGLLLPSFQKIVEDWTGFTVAHSLPLERHAVHEAKR